MTTLYLKAGQLDPAQVVSAEDLRAAVNAMLQSVSKMAAMLPKDHGLDPSHPIVQTGAATLWIDDVTKAQGVMRDLFGAEPLDLASALRNENSRLLSQVALLTAQRDALEAEKLALEANISALSVEPRGGGKP